MLRVLRVLRALRALRVLMGRQVLKVSKALLAQRVVVALGHLAHLIIGAIQDLMEVLFIM